MAFCIDFSEVDLAEEIEFLPLIYKDFTTADQCIMFDKIQKIEKEKNISLMTKFKSVYEFTYNEPFSMPIFSHPITYYENLKLKDQEDEDYDNCYGPPLEAKIANISLDRGSKESCELISVQPTLILDTVYYSKKGNRPIRYDDDDEGAPLLTKSLWKKIQSEMNVDNESTIQEQSNETLKDSQKGESNSEYKKEESMKDNDNNYCEINQPSKNNNKIKGGKKIHRRCPYSLRPRQSNHGDSNCCDAIAVPESMDVESAEEVGHISSKFIEEKFISVKKKDTFIFLCNGSEYIKLSKTQSQVAYYSDGKIWVEQFCKSKLTALSLLKGYIENRDEVNSIWNISFNDMIRSANDDSALNKGKPIAIAE